MAHRKRAPAPEPGAPARKKRSTPNKAPQPAKAVARKQPTPFRAWAAQSDAIGVLCAKIAEGDNVWSYSQREKIPYSSLRQWIDADVARADKYARAREDRADKLADEIVAISDEADVALRHDGEDMRLALDAAAIARNRLRVDARKWVAAKLKPRVYGEKVAHGGDPDAPPIQHSMAVRFVDAHATGSVPVLEKGR